MSVLAGRGRLKRIWQQLFYVFLLVVWVMRVCVAIFFRRRFFRLLGFALSLALSHGERG
ncbi:hypothetical protein MCC93_21650 [Morococcus cerebrosus]|uniref:Uncharacterized protein n=1 Tax=Morococcus cerebrosus TaxID=1056807 RepID=A0A0C1EC36_9NEIS|nr:hypothetical protein MCC93_21650 [Morococcus cerebrosus]